MKKKKKTGTKRTYNRPAARREELPGRLAKFLAHFAQTGNVRSAANKAKLSYVTIYNYKKSNAEFANAFEEARQVAVDFLEGDCFRRALDGVKEPVFHNGKKCGDITKYSNGLAVALLKAHRRKLYGDSVKHTGDEDEPIRFEDIGRKGAVEKLADVLVGLGVKAPPRSGS